MASQYVHLGDSDQEMSPPVSDADGSDFDDVANEQNCVKRRCTQVR